MSLTTTPVPPSPGLRDWEPLISFRPPADIQATVNKRFRGGKRACQAIEEGHGPINLDYYPVRVTELPSAAGRKMPPEEVLEHIRRNLTVFVENSPNGCKFSPYDADIDRDAWLPPTIGGAAGAVLSIDMIGNGVKADDGSVVLAESATDHWVFTTLWTPGDLYHPVSGNRLFGYVPEAGGFVYFIRGMDRVSTLVHAAGMAAVFASSDHVWRSWQQRVAEFVNGNRGAAAVEPSVANRYDWEEVKSAYFHPTVGWIG